MKDIDAAMREMEDLIASGNNVPIAAFGKWEALVQTGLDELLAQYQRTGDVDGIERIENLQAQVDKLMSAILKGIDNSATK